MKSLCSLILLTSLVTALAGPSELPAAGDNLLLAAGFQVRKPESVEQRQLYAISPSYRMLRAGRTPSYFYLYKDEGAGLAYVGNEDNYRRYSELAAQEGYAYGFYQAKEVESDPAWRLAEAFGVSHVWACRNRVALSEK